jgi:molybdenum cofactor synthesis domain-containing protein
VEYRLLDKREIWITPLELREADLDECARAAGQVLGLDERQIMVTDAIGNRLALDILVPTVHADQIVAKEPYLLAALAQVPGVTVSEATRVHSEGVLGLISVSPAQGTRIVQRSLTMRNEILERISRRSMVIPTGAELVKGQIRDTNTPFLVEKLRTLGYHAESGPVAGDDAPEIRRALMRAAEDAFGLVITTGGIGAEGKDQTLEALIAVDSKAHTPYVLKFHQGHGRHVKDGVRLGVGRLDPCRIVCLPGPHDEVELLWPVVRDGLNEAWDDALLAARLAERLSAKFLAHGHHRTVTEEAFTGDMQ